MVGDSRVDHLRADFERHRTAELDRQIMVDTRLAGMGSTMDDLTERIALLAEAIIAAQKAAAMAAGTAATVEGAVTVLGRRLSTVESTVAMLQARGKEPS